MAHIFTHRHVLILLRHPVCLQTSSCLLKRQAGPCLIIIDPFLPSFPPSLIHSHPHQVRPCGRSRTIFRTPRTNSFFNLRLGSPLEWPLRGSSNSSIALALSCLLSVFLALSHKWMYVPTTHIHTYIRTYSVFGHAASTYSCTIIVNRGFRPRFPDMDVSLMASSTLSFSEANSNFESMTDMIFIIIIIVVVVVVGYEKRIDLLIFFRIRNAQTNPKMPFTWLP